jgi:hypothetical protein
LRRISARFGLGACQRRRFRGVASDRRHILKTIHPVAKGLTIDFTVRQPRTTSPLSATI